MVTAFALIAALGCAKSEPAPQTPAVAALHTENAVELIPAAGLRWLLLGRPRELLENSAFRAALTRLFPKERIQAFSTRTGIDLERTESALIAGYDLSTVYAVTQESNGNARVLSAFRERLHGGERVSEPHPRLRRVSGTLGGTPEAVLTVGDRTALVSIGDPRLVRVAEAFALGRLARSVPAFRGVVLSKIGPPTRDALAVLYVLGPFEAEWSRAASGLLSSADALSMALIPAGAGLATLRLELAGQFRSDDTDRLLGVVTQIASSTPGRVLGLDRPATQPVVQLSSGHLALTVTLETTAIAEGLHSAVSAEAWEILNLPTPHLH
jgi:hypothetical protein